MPDSLQSRNRDKRDRKSTEESIIAAFETVLLRDGVAGLGVNAIAQEAGINKVLIYRYFVDLPGLARRWCEASDFWPSELELIGNDPDAFAALPIVDGVRTVMRNYVDAIRARPRTIELLAAELMAPTDVTRALADGLARTGIGIGAYTHINTNAPQLIEQVWKLTYLVNAITAYMAVRRGGNSMYLGYDLKTDEAWDYLRAIVDEMTVRFLND